MDYTVILTNWAIKPITFYALHEVTSDAFLIPTRGADWGDNGRWRKLHAHMMGLESSDIIKCLE